MKTIRWIGLLWIGSVMLGATALQGADTQQTQKKTGAKLNADGFEIVEPSAPKKDENGFEFVERPQTGEERWSQTLSIIKNTAPIIAVSFLVVGVLVLAWRTRARQFAMTKGERCIVWCGVALVVLMGIFPPWQFVLDRGATMYRTLAAGYGFIDSPPPMPKYFGYEYVRLDIARLLVQWVVVCVATFGLWVTFRERK